MPKGRTWIDSGISITGYVPLTVPGYSRGHLCNAIVLSCSDVKSSCLNPGLGGGHPNEDSNISPIRGILFYRTLEVLDQKSRKCGS